MSGPLEGIRVLDLTSVVMGPYATQILGDYGADVIKIEPPRGDVMRQSGPMKSPNMGHFYLTTNRNKRSLVLDLKKEKAKNVLLQLASKADVLVYNSRPQSMARLGLSYEEIYAVSPNIIYVGAYGFSQKGPYADRPAYDDLIQGMCAIPWLNHKYSGQAPRYAPLVLVDRMLGLQLCNAITSALFARSRTGKGQKVDVPMFEGMLSVVLGEHLAGKLFDPPQGEAGYQRSIARDRRPYETKDGYICVLIYNDKQWSSFFQVIAQPEIMLEDPRFSSQGNRLANIDYVYGFLSQVLRTRKTKEWIVLLNDADIPAAEMLSIDEILTDEHLKATGFFNYVNHPTEGTMVNMSVSTEWSETSPTKNLHAPNLGENNFEILTELGYSLEEIALINK